MNSVIEACSPGQTTGEHLFHVPDSTSLLCLQPARSEKVALNSCRDHQGLVHMLSPQLCCTGCTSLILLYKSLYSHYAELQYRATHLPFLSPFSTEGNSTHLQGYSRQLFWGWGWLLLERSSPFLLTAEGDWLASSVDQFFCLTPWNFSNASKPLLGQDQAVSFEDFSAQLWH